MRALPVPTGSFKSRGEFYSRGRGRFGAAERSRYCSARAASCSADQTAAT